VDRRAKAIFMVEFSGDEAAEVSDRVERLHKRLGGVNGLVTAVPALAIRLAATSCPVSPTRSATSRRRQALSLVPCWVSLSSG
jgi:hypothetical protein